MNGQNGSLLDALQLLINISAAFPAITWIISLISTLIGVWIIGNTFLQMYAMSSDDGKWRGKGSPTPAGIVFRLVFGGVLVCSFFMIGISGNTLLAGEAANGGAMLYQSAGLSAMQKAAIQAIYGLLGIIGYIAFIKGWMIFDAHANNTGQVSIGMGIAFIVGGTAAIYLDAVMKVLTDWTGFDFVNLLLF